jgi:hypothetical protein
MDVGKAFTFLFEDENWIAKVAIGGLLVLFSWLLVPIPLMVGYALQVTKNVAEGQSKPLPEWTNLGDMFVQGLMAIIGSLIWFSPVILLVCCIAAVGVATGGVASSDDSGTASGFAGALIVCFQCVTFIVSLALSFFIYAPITRFALNGKLDTFWDFQGTWQFIQGNIGNYVIAWLLLLVANFVAGFGVILCVIGVFFTSFWAYLVGAHLFGQVARTNMPPADSTLLPPAPPMDEPPSMMQGPYEPAPSA